MEAKFIELLLTLNSINRKLKELSAELDKLNSNLIDEDFEKLFLAEQIGIIAPEDYE